MSWDSDKSLFAWTTSCTLRALNIHYVIIHISREKKPRHALSRNVKRRPEKSSKGNISWKVSARFFLIARAEQLKFPEFVLRYLGQILDIFPCLYESVFEVKPNLILFQIVICQRLMSSVGVSPESLAKVFIIQSQLVRKGAHPRNVAEVMKMAIGTRTRNNLV